MNLGHISTNFETKTTLGACVLGVTPSLVHYGFENFKLNEIYDDSGNNINAVLVSGAHVTRKEAKCGASVELNGGEVVISGQTLQDKQIEAITIQND